MQKLSKISFLILLVFAINNAVFAQNQAVTFNVNVKENASTDFIPADEGKPDLKSTAKYVAIPKNSSFEIEIVSKSEKITENVYIAPASKLSNDLDLEDNPAIEDSAVYSRDEFYPKEVITCERTSFRDFDLLLIGIALEQYNPVQRTLKTFDNLTITCHFDRPSSSRHFDRPQGVNKSPSHFFRSLVINPEFFGNNIYEDNIYNDERRDGCEYLIITPNDSVIKAWADTLRNFREEQGIITRVVTLQEVGSNNPDSLKAYLQHGYNEWSLSPAAVLLLGDYSSDPASGITSYALNDHPDGHAYEPYLADNKLVDFNGDGLPDIVIARMPAASGGEAQLMVQKTIHYERYPYSDEAYYAHPVTAMGYQRSRWFQLCTEVVAGYLDNIGKQSIHLNAIHQGIPDSVWSTGQRTDLVLDLFGPSGLGYIPATMSHLTEWNADANSIKNALNDGSYMLIHRDHGSFEAWGEPEFNTWFINRLNNDKLTFVMSANCQTGAFNYGDDGSDCLAERFLRVPNGAVGVIAASQLSYSYVNDTYVWGFFDYLYPDFMPNYGTQNIDFQRPAFANAYGKYFLKQSSFPYNASFKNITNNLFHYFGDAYLQLYSEVPRQLTVTHPENINQGEMMVTIKADEDAVIALSVDNQLIARGKSNGEEMTLHYTSILNEGDIIKVVATKQNHYRHESFIVVSNNIGIEEIQNDNFKIYPNPVNDMLHIEGDNINNIKIINVLGQEMISKNTDFNANIHTIDCQNLHDGIYFIVISGKTTTTKHLIKKGVL